MLALYISLIYIALYICIYSPISVYINKKYLSNKGIAHLSKTLGSSSQSISDLWHSHGGVL